MTMIFTHMDEALDCATALSNAGRPYHYEKNAKGEHMITTRD